jgi:hypothetical protein
VGGSAHQGGAAPALSEGQIYLIYLITTAHIAALLCLHLTLPTLADEAYYAWWGTAPALGYLDHPPAVMAWGWLGGELLWGPRALNLCLAPLTAALLVSAARALGVEGARWLALAALCTPLGIALGVLLTPDAPLLLGWSLAVWGLAHRREWAGALGLALGVWSKAMVIPAGVGLLWAWWWRGRRGGSARPLGPPLRVALIALALYAPHIAWSRQSEWLPWSFQGSRPWGRFSLAEWALGQLWVGTPLWALWGLRGAWGALQQARRGELSERSGVLLALSAPSVGVWALASLGTRVEANWTALAWPGLLMLALTEAPLPQQRLRALLTGAALTLPLAALPLAHHLLPAHLGPPRDGARLERCAREALGGAPLPLVSGRYQEASLVWASGSSAPLYYLRADGRRRSELDRALERADGRVSPPPACGFVYLGPEAWLAGRCAGEVSVTAPVGGGCAVPLTLCSCGGTGGGAGGGSGGR